MEELARNKGVFIGLSCLSIACLIGSFANPLQQLEVWRQNAVNGLGIEYDRNFIITESDSNLPYGFVRDEAVKVASVYQDYKFEKLMLLIASFSSATVAVCIGNSICSEVEINSEISELKAKGKKQLVVESIKHRLAMASKSQRLLFMDEMKALMEEFGSMEGEILDADEINETDKFTAASYLLADGLDADTVVTQVWGMASESPSHQKMKARLTNWMGDSDDVSQTTGIVDMSFRSLFPESMDSVSRKAVLKASEGGVSDEDIISDVLSCSEGQIELGRAYIAFLRS